MANTSSTCSEKHPFILNGNLSSVEICDGSWLSTPYRSSFFQSSDHNDGGHSLLPNHPPEVSNCPLQRSLCSYEVLGSVFVTSNVVGIDVVRVRNSKFEEQGYPCVRICIGVQCSLYKLITEEALSTESSGHNYSNTNSWHNTLQLPQESYWQTITYSMHLWLFNISMMNGLTHKTLGSLDARVKQPHPQNTTMQSKSSRHTLSSAAKQLLPNSDNAFNECMSIDQNSESRH